MPKAEVDTSLSDVSALNKIDCLGFKSKLYVVPIKGYGFNAPCVMLIASEPVVLLFFNLIAIIRSPVKSKTSPKLFVRSVKSKVPVPVSVAP